jgi:hypothetical protein
MLISPQLKICLYPFTFCLDMVGAFLMAWGRELGRRGFDVMGRETLGDFKKLRFDAQVETVAEDLKASFGITTRWFWPTLMAPICCFKHCLFLNHFQARSCCSHLLLESFQTKIPAWVSSHPMPKGFKNWLKAANFHCPDAAKSMLAQKTGKAFQTTSWHSLHW